MAENDFFMLINKKWIDRTTIPSYRGTYGISEQLEEQIDKKLITLLRHTLTTKSSNKITRLVHSVLNDSVQHFNIEKMKLLMKDIDCMKTTSDVCKNIGMLNKYQLTSPLNILINHDSYKSSKCLIHLYEPELGLPTYDHYSKSDSDHVLTSYTSMLKKIGDLLESHDLEQVLQIEKRVLTYLSSNGDLDDPAKSHNEFTFEKLQTTYKNIDWDSMFLEYGIELKKSDTVIVTNLKYMSALDKMFETFEMKVWSIWLRSYCLLSLLKYLPPPFDDLHYELFGKALRGEEVKLPQPKLLLHVFDNFANQTLSHIYVHNTSGAVKIKEQAEFMINGLKNATIRLIKKCTWMSTKAKTMAIHKVSTMQFQTGFDNHLLTKDRDFEFESLEISNDCLINNILMLSEQKTKKNIEKIGSGCDKYNRDWEDGAYEVNAYYYADQNKMVVPLGILQPPFFDSHKSVAWNYGGIGAAIGHEITHAFDEDGHHYDHTGSWVDWWTTHDKHHYSLITNKVEELYDGLEYMDGHVDGHLTFDENLADIGGLEISLEALEHAFQTNRIINESDKKALYNDFFTSYAMSWRLKDRPQKAKQSLILDHHAPAHYRVNIPVAMFEQFYTTYNVSEKDDMYIDKKDRTLLFSS